MVAYMIYLISLRTQTTRAIAYTLGKKRLLMVARAVPQWLADVAEEMRIMKYADQLLNPLRKRILINVSPPSTPLLRAR